MGLVSSLTNHRDTDAQRKAGTARIFLAKLAKYAKKSKTFGIKNQDLKVSFATFATFARDAPWFSF